MAVALALSASSVEAYRSCHWRWYLQYVESMKGDSTVEQAVGIAVHAAIEDYYKALIADLEPPNLIESLDVFDTAYLLETTGMADPGVDFRKMRLIGRRVTVAYVEDVAPSVVPAFAEMPGLITVNGIGYSLHIDLIDSNRVVRDTKVKGSKPRDASRYLFAMTGYALGYRTLVGQRETDVQIDVMVRLKRDRPYHVPLRYGGPITDLDVGRFARTLQETAEGIGRDDFRPTGLETGECRWCPVRSACVYIAEFTRENGEVDAPSNDAP